MKTSRAILSALVLASATLVPLTAQAGKIDPAQSFELAGTHASFGNLFTGGNAGQGFADRYLFTLSSAGDLVADLTTRAGNEKNGLDITGFSLYNMAGELLASSAMAKNFAEVFKISVDNLAAGSYYLQIDGSLKSNAAGRYAGNLAIDIPEPATMALMLGAVGLLGVGARRRSRPPMLRA